MDTKRLQIVTLVAVLVIRVASAVDVPADTAVCISEMPGQMIITNSTGSLRWPAEGETYPTDRRCYWRIAAPSGKIIRYKFLMFDVHSSDYLELFQSGNLAASSQYPDYAYQYTHAIYNEGKGFPNEELGATTVTYLNRLHIVLDTDDDANVGKGFHIEWEVIDQTECFYTTVDHGEDKMIINSTDTYTLDYPSNHDKYGPYHSCLWIIQPPPGKAIKYRFVDLNMFGSSAVYSYSPLGAVVSMYDDPSILDDRTEFLATDFLGVFSYSSDGYNDDGWIISWEFVDADCVPCFQTNGECVDRNKDGKNDTCICPPGKCSVNLTLGCDRDCVYGGWSSWTDWSSCSVTCGDGIETRERLCNNPTPVGDSSYDCPGEDLETRPCEKDKCPVQGGWSSWGSWSSCPLLCGGNGDDFETRNRTCDRPPPVGGPEYDCEGDDSEERVCGNGTCPVQGGWGTWSSWTTCPITCGGNGEDSQTRNRSCDSPVPVGGPDYYCEGVDFEGRPCGETRCPVEGGWGTWSSWTTCPVTCGGIGEDFETRNRTCDNPLPFGGPDYDCEGNSTQERVCGESKCPVPGGWGDWSSWSTCPVTCGSGLQIRSRSCDNPPPVGGPSYDCKGASSSTQSCWEYECPGDWTTWGSWSSCSTTCGEGIRVRHRQCSNGTCIGEFRDTKPCVLQACSDDEGCVVPLPGDFCEDDSQCKRLSDRMYCDNVCTCIYGYYPENGNCIRIKLGSPCSDEDFCRRGVKNSICDQSKCACPSFMVHIGSGESSACVHSFSPLSYPACQICANTEGVCYDSDQDATPDSCDCSPLRFRPSDPSNQLATGCDQCYAYPGEYCRADGAVICTDPNSECVHDGPLHGGFICQCRTGFVSVPGKADPKKRICARHIPPALDEECQVCVSNAGKCYDVDGDNKMDGCLCPLTRTSTCDLASHACDKQHVTVNCTSSDMTICIHDKDDFVGELSGMFVEGYGDILACHFKPVDEITWCLTLDYDNKDLCGLNVLDTKDTTSYYIWITLEHHSGIMSYLDVCLYGYCTYYKKACTHTGLLDVTTKKLTASEGESVRPGATMNIYNKFGRNLELVGASLGDSVKLVVEIVDDKNIYVALRAEVCVVSNMLSLSHPHVESAVFILNGCPVDESESGIRPPVVFMPDKKNLLKIMTNNFGIPKFSTDMVFFQCCVKVCIDAKKCAPRTCPTGRRKRALSRQSGSSLLKEYAESPDTITSVVGVFVHQRTDSKNSFISPANDASRKVMETVDSTSNSEDDPKDVYKSVILACTAVGVVTVMGVVAHVYLKRRRESL